MTLAPRPLPLCLLLACRPLPAPPAPRGHPTAACWRVALREDFEARSIGPLGDSPWLPDDFPDDGPFAERGAYFARRGVPAPPGLRAELSFGAQGWLTAASYASDPRPAWAERLAVTADPSGQRGQVLRLRSPRHQDATVIRGSAALPRRYRLSVRVGFAEFGDGVPGGNNGYARGTEWAGPWKPRTAVDHNGFYWLALLDHPPRPHNNIWIHHHRKAVIDSCSHFPPWMEIWDGGAFVPSGARPVMMFVLDGRHPEREQSGPLFRSFAAGRWQPLGAVRAADAYLPRTWYQARITREDDVLTLEVAGRFRHGAERRYRGQINGAEVGVFQHGAPDYFMLGDPHINYYEGQVFYDDITLELPAPCP